MCDLNPSTHIIAHSAVFIYSMAFDHNYQLGQPSPKYDEKSDHEKVNENIENSNIFYFTIGFYNIYCKIIWMRWCYYYCDIDVERVALKRIYGT